MVIFPGFENEGEEPLCIHFANTVGYRGSDTPSEGLKTPKNLALWAEAHKLPHEAVGLEAAKAMREAVYRILLSAVEGTMPAASDLEALNRRLQVALGKTALSKELKPELTHYDLFDAIALSTAQLLGSPDRGRLRVCADPACRWLFIDRSKNQSRRWCSMRDCGNLAKARRFRGRVR